MAEASAAPHKKILVVEDDEDFIVLIRMMLASEPVDLLPVLTGARALEAARAHPPNLVILDLLLPDMNGWEVFMQLQADPALQHIPVIILSSQGTRTDRNFSLQVARVSDYLMKPCLPSQLRRSVQRALYPQPVPVS